MVRCAAPLDWATRDFSDEIGLISEGALEAAYDLNLIQIEEDEDDAFFMAAARVAVAEAVREL